MTARHRSGYRYECLRPTGTKEAPRVPDLPHPPCPLPPAPLPLEAAFDGGRLTTDGGLPWLAEAEAALGLCARLGGRRPGVAARAGAAHPGDAGAPAGVPDRLRLRGPGRRRHAAHRPAAQAGLRAAARERAGPGQPADLLAAGERGRPAAPATAWRLALVGGVPAASAGAAAPPARILLDLDSTDDPTHGEQEGSAYHGYYRQHMYHPLLVFDGDTDQLITAVLRPGNAHGSRRRGRRAASGSCAALRARWPDVADRAARRQRLRHPGALRLLRARAASPTPSAWSPTPRLERAGRAAPRRGPGRQAARATGAKVRLAGEAPLPGRAAGRATAGRLQGRGPGRRDRTPASSSPPAPTRPLALYDWYVDRGEPENWIKDFKHACFADRLSCHRFWANQFRLLLHAAAYWLLDTLRRWLVAAGRRAPAARHPPPAPPQDRRPGPPARHPRPPAPRHQPSRRAPLAPPRRPPRPPVNNPG